MFETLKKLNIQVIGIEQNLTYFEFTKFKKETGFKLKLINPIIKNLRQIKDKKEIALLRSVARLTDITFEYIKSQIKLGVTEIEIADRLETFVKKNGSTLSFDSIVAYGVNSATPHHKPTNKKLTKNDQFVLLDFGAKSKNYCSDMTRTILTKSATNRAKLVYQTVWQAQNEAAKKIGDGERKITQNC